MNINPDLPLPDNLKVKYEECLAKIILETLFGDEFKNLEIDCERPDLQSEDMSVGVEVTISENTKQMRQKAYTVKLSMDLQGILSML